MKHLHLLLLILFLVPFWGCDDEEAAPICNNLLSFGPEVLRFPAPGLATVNDFTISPRGIMATGMIDRNRLHLSEFATSGELNWTKPLSVETGETVMVVPSINGGFLVGGRTRAFGSITQYLLTRTDEEGNELWTRDFGGPGIDNAAGLAETDAGKYLIFGTTSEVSNITNLFSDLRLTCVNQDGSQAWTRTFNLSPEDRALSFIRPRQAAEKYWGLASISRSSSTFNDLILIEFSSDGTEMNRQSLGITEESIWSPQAFSPTSDGGAIITISTNADETQNVRSNPSLIKITSAGTLEWIERYPSINGSTRAVLQNADGGYTFIGNKSGFQREVSVLYIANTTETGAIRWCREFSMTEYGAMNDLIQLEGGGYLLTGNASEEPSPFIFSLWTLRLDEEGVPIE